MKFELSGRQYDSRFQYDPETNPLGRVVEKTTCFISEIDPNKVGRERYTIVAQASVVRNVKDANNRLLARKVAFGRTLEKFIPGRNQKDIRAEIWQEYLENIRV